MPISQDKSAPYAPAKAILEVVDRHRSRGLPSPVDNEVLVRAGISESLIPRTLQALHTLDLINQDGSHTDVLEGLRLAPETEYKQRLLEWLNVAYRDVLQYVDPATDNETAVRDAFRPFKPTGQQDRMVMLFIGLYSAAGVWPDKPRSDSAPKPSRPRPVTQQVKKGRETLGVRPKPKPAASSYSADEIPAPLAGLLTSLPADGEGWTKERRDKFVSTFGAVVDYCFPLVEHSTADSTEKKPANEG